MPSAPAPTTTADDVTVPAGSGLGAAQGRRPSARERAAGLLPSRRGALLWAGGALAFGALLGLLQLGGTRVSTLTRDVTAVAGVAPTTGIISTGGYLVLAATAGICGALAFAAGTARAGRGRFLAATAAIVGLLLADDVLLLHEELAPKTLGVPETAIFAAYAGLATAWLIAFRTEILRFDVALLAAAGACMALSVLADASARVPVALEDFPKLVGFGTLLAYALRESRRVLRPPAAP